jgi:catechol 2,3-dioxygenase-like lactoylglutathione lyase family enzyme
VVSAVAAIGITVADMTVSRAFYRDVLGFTVVDERRLRGEVWERLHGVAGADLHVVRMRLGAEEIELTEWRAPRGRPVPADSRSHDAWFQHIAIIVRDMDEAHRWLRGHGVAGISPAPQRLPDWNVAAGGIEAFYFRDPDGHPLEILKFPPDKGDARWHRATTGRFLGIDHTAIVVRDTAASLRLYRDHLGLRVVGRSENWGPEQAKLNDVAGAHLRITTLRAAAGPAVELLDYLQPGGGRPARADARANDLAHWQIVFVGAVPAVMAGAAPLGLTARGPVLIGGAPTAVLRDPDGHALQIRATYP